MSNQSKNSSSKTSWILIGILVIIMLISKPDKNDFQEYISSAIEDNTETLVEEWMSKIGSSIASSFETKDYFLFTLNTHYILDEKNRYIGVFGYFIPLD